MGVRILFLFTIAAWPLSLLAQDREGDVIPFISSASSSWGCIISELGDNAALRLRDPISTTTDVDSVSIAFETTSQRRFKRMRRSSNSAKRRIGKAGLLCLGERGRFSNSFDKPVGDGNGAGGGGGSGGSGGGGEGGGSGGGSDSDACTIIASGAFMDSRTLSPSQRIINGTKCEVGDSAVVELTITSPLGLATCTGVAVGPRKILSAAHCVVDTVGDCDVIATNIQVRGGSDGTLLDASASFVAHPDYACVSTAPGGGQNDVIVVTTDTDLTIQQIPVVTSSDDLRSGAQLLIAGYGLVDSNNDGEADGFEGDGLQAGFMTIDSVTTSEILSSFTFSDPDPGSNTCSGDSGGPALVKVGDDYRVAGLTSYGVSPLCGPTDAIVGFVNLTDPNVQSFLADNGVTD
ncbi:MAG: trypsin-like serine protease [Bdellovibrionales bacterium]|nr:trypsin-like serine protease [Bdellovibrionales bacterium]